VEQLTRLPTTRFTGVRDEDNLPLDREPQVVLDELAAFGQPPSA
jgi:hypothetical protein